MTMQNAMMDLFKQLNDNAMSSAKRVGELNMKTFETLTAKQTALLSSCFEAGTKNADALSKAKDPKEVFAMQQEVLKSCGEKWLANVREAAELLTATRDELVAIAEEAAKQASQTTEKATELSKQALTDNMEKASAAVEKAMAKATALTQEAATAGKEAADKAVAAGKEVADKTIAAGKEVADKTVAATKKAAEDVKSA
jgi:colicin import membrane protein